MAVQKERPGSVRLRAFLSVRTKDESLAYQRTATPNRATRGAMMPLTTFAFAAT